MDLIRDSRNLLTIVDLCGSESSQVVAAHVAHLVHRLAPDFRLRVANRLSEIGEDGDSEAGGARGSGYVLLLPSEPKRTSSIWQHIRHCAEPKVPALPLRIGDYATQASPAFGVSSLPEICISSSDARIEHGGQLYLEREIAGVLSRHLGDLLTLTRHSAARNSFLRAAAGASCPNLRLPSAELLH